MDSIDGLDPRFRDIYFDSAKAYQFASKILRGEGCLIPKLLWRCDNITVVLSFCCLSTSIVKATDLLDNNARKRYCHLTTTTKYSTKLMELQQRHNVLCSMHATSVLKNNLSLKISTGSTMSYFLCIYINYGSTTVRSILSSTLRGKATNWRFSFYKMHLNHRDLKAPTKELCKGENKMGAIAGKETDLVFHIHT